jgi:glycosyltransferase involved in cell wall biosynthesis
MSPLVTTVIPAYNEGLRLPPTLERLATVLAAAPSPVQEIIVVDDGSRAEDAESERRAAEAAEAALEKAGAPHRIRFVAAPCNQGKGSAIRLGWTNADPATVWLGFLDADGAISAEEHLRLARMLEGATDFDVLAGSRVKMAGKQIDRVLFRHLQGRVFATMVEMMFELGFYDTQCGIKFARSSLLRPSLSQLEEERWLLDVEMLALLKRHHARFREEPIDWIDRVDSKVRFGIDAARMFVGLQKIKHRLDKLEG